jgi:hypothetical protein
MELKMKKEKLKREISGLQATVPVARLNRTK